MHFSNNMVGTITGYVSSSRGRELGILQNHRHQHSRCGLRGNLPHCPASVCVCVCVRMCVCVCACERACVLE